MNADSKTFIIYVVIWKQEEMLVHSKKQAQVEALLFDKAPIEVLVEYFDYSNIFSAENTAELLEYTGMNNHAIKLEESKQPPCDPIYSRGSVELETLKIYIKTNLANGFIRSSISPTEALILFNRKPNRSLRFCINYQGLNNIIIKNWYPLLLIGKLLNWLGLARRFTQLDLIITYHQMKICEGHK